MLRTESDIHFERVYPDEQFWLDQVTHIEDFFTKVQLINLFVQLYLQLHCQPYMHQYYLTSINSIHRQAYHKAPSGILQQRLAVH